jgi:hypothetical protein
LAINTSPEPFSNWMASIAEDVTVLGSLWLIFNHPWVMLILLLGFVVVVIWLVPKLFQLAKSGFQSLRKRLRRADPGSGGAAPTGSPQTG